MRATLEQAQKIAVDTRQMPRLASRLLAQGRQELLAGIRQEAARNPALVVDWGEATPRPPEHTMSLAEHLAEQLGKTPMAREARDDALLCLGSLDERGYLPRPRELAKKARLGQQRAARAAAAIRELSPVGVGAHDLADCLLLQLGEKDASADVARARTMVERHFASLARGRHDLLPAAGRQRALAVIASLRPRFANDFLPAATQSVAEIEAHNVRGVWMVRATNTPSVSVCATGGGAKWRRLVREAHSYADAVGFRNATLLKVAQALVDRQRAFLERGKQALVPVRLRDLASDTGLSVSTVAAAIAHKGIATPSGTFALKYLLQRRVTSDGRLSAAALQEAIKDLLQGEDPARPFTDEEIMRALRPSCGTIARRTIAKHRAMGGFLPSNLRRRRNG